MWLDTDSNPKWLISINLPGLTNNIIIVTFAPKIIEKGEEITDTYCPTFASLSQKNRQEKLA